jgi:ribosome maturation factor RimP
VAATSGVETEAARAPEWDAAEPRFVRETGLAGRIADIIEPQVEAAGFRLVRVVLSGRDGGTLQVMAERPDGTMTVADCAELSRGLGPVLEAADPIPHSYRLEVSSPGIDRPLVRQADFAAFAGHEARIELKEPVEGRKRFRGEIEGFEDGEVRLRIETEGETEGKVIGLAGGLIESARLVLTDELVQASLRSGKKQSKEAGRDRRAAKKAK